eukprot:71398-Pelagomonas_calceolata.AAC.1
MKAVNIKHGKYLPEAQRNYPWEQAGRFEQVPIPFILQSQITKGELEGNNEREWLHSKIMDKSSFDECIKTLSNSKSPGPDGVVNEILKILSPEIQESIHKLFIIMWATRLTPVSWTRLVRLSSLTKTKEKRQSPLGLPTRTWDLSSLSVCRASLSLNFV